VIVHQACRVTSTNRPRKGETALSWAGRRFTTGGLRVEPDRRQLAYNGLRLGSRLVAAAGWMPARQPSDTVMSVAAHL
jgi:hypothetical protein